MPEFFQFKLNLLPFSRYGQLKKAKKNAFSLQILVDFESQESFLGQSDEKILVGNSRDKLRSILELRRIETISLPK